MAIQIRLILTKRKMKMQNDADHSRIMEANQLYQDVYQQNVQMKYWKHDLREMMVNHPEYQHCDKIMDLLQTIILSKKERAAKAGVTMAFDQDVDRNKLENVFRLWDREDIVRLVTNIVNNAIEAAEKCEDGRIIVRIGDNMDHSGNDTDNICIVVQNSMIKGKAPLKNGFKSDKSDAGEHGLGSKIIREIVAKHQGRLEIMEEEQEFIMKVYVSG